MPRPPTTRALTPEPLLAPLALVGDQRDDGRMLALIFGELLEPLKLVAKAARVLLRGAEIGGRGGGGGWGGGGGGGGGGCIADSKSMVHWASAEGG